MKCTPKVILTYLIVLVSIHLIPLGLISVAGIPVFLFLQLINSVLIAFSDIFGARVVLGLMM